MPAATETVQQVKVLAVEAWQPKFHPWSPYKKLDAVTGICNISTLNVSGRRRKRSHLEALWPTSQYKAQQLKQDRPSLNKCLLGANFQSHLLTCIHAL